MSFLFHASGSVGDLGGNHPGYPGPNNPITCRPFGPNDGHHDSALRFLGFFSHALLVPGSETEQSRAIS